MFHLLACFPKSIIFTYQSIRRLMIHRNLESYLIKIIGWKTIRWHDVSIVETRLFNNRAHSICSDFFSLYPNVLNEKNIIQFIKCPSQCACVCVCVSTCRQTQVYFIYTYCACTWLIEINKDVASKRNVRAECENSSMKSGNTQKVSINERIDDTTWTEGNKAKL